MRLNPLEDALQQYRRDVEAMETSVAEQNGQIVGFLTLNQHDPCLIIIKHLICGGNPD